MKNGTVEILEVAKRLIWMGEFHLFILWLSVWRGVCRSSPKQTIPLIDVFVSAITVNRMLIVV